MKARLLGANLVDLALAAAIAALPAHVLALAWAARPVLIGLFPEGSLDGPSVVTRLGCFVAVVGVTFVGLRWFLERRGQTPGKCLFSLRLSEGQVIEDADGLEPLERLGVFASRFAPLLVLGLASLVGLGVWGGALERTAVQAQQMQFLRTAYSYDAEKDCCFAPQAKGECPRMLELWADVAAHSDGKGDVPPGASLLERCPGARKYSQR